jgi:hypothetical protein
VFFDRRPEQVERRARPQRSQSENPPALMVAPAEIPEDLCRRALAIRTELSRIDGQKPTLESDGELDRDGRT